MDIQSWFEKRDAYSALLEQGRYQEFVDAAANMDDRDIAEIVSYFARRIRERVPELGFCEARAILVNFRESVLKAGSFSWEVCSRYNSAIRNVVERANATDRLAEVQELSHGTREITQAELVQELDRILALSPRKMRPAYRELFGSIALQSLPLGIASCLEVALMRFSKDALKRTRGIVSHSRAWTS